MPEGRLEFDNDIELEDGVVLTSPSLDLVDYPYVSFTIRKLAGLGEIKSWCLDGSPSKHEDSYSELVDLDDPPDDQEALMFASGRATAIKTVGDYENFVVKSIGMYQLRVRALSEGDMLVNVSGMATEHA